MQYSFLPVVTIISMISALVDNVPLVAVAMGMCGPAQYPPGSFLREFSAHCAGTADSILIIGRQPVGAAMEAEKSHVLRCVKRISPLTLVG